MSVSSSYAWTLSRDQIIRTAYQLCGEVPMGKEPTADQITGASTLLNAIVKAMQNNGVILSSVTRTTVTTTASTASYTAAADTIDVDWPAYVTQTSGSSTLPLTEMTRDEYMGISDKTTEGIPTRMYVEKGTGTVTLILWPVPDSTVSSFTYARVRLTRDMDSGSVNLDLGVNWIKAITYMLAHDLALALSMPMDKVAYLKSLSEAELKKAEGNDAERGDITFVVNYG